MPIVKTDDISIRQAARLISEGELVAFPTETVYGLGADAFNKNAIAKIFDVKNRPYFDPLIVHIASLEKLEDVADISLLDSKIINNLDLLIKKFWPGPLTLIFPKQKSIPDLVTSGLTTVAIRFPAHSAAKKLIELSGTAIAAPSANPFGYLSPTRAEHVLEMLGDKVRMILDGGLPQVGLESTVLDICREMPRILRPGGITKEAIEEMIGPVETAFNSDDGNNLSSPGMLKSHYAPKTPLVLFDKIPAAEVKIEKTALLFFDGPSRDRWLLEMPECKTPLITVLSEAGNLQEAAANLFEALHKIDKESVAAIYAQLAPEEGLGIAINDRLQRAALAKLKPKPQIMNIQ